MSHTIYDTFEPALQRMGYTTTRTHIPYPIGNTVMALRVSDDQNHVCILVYESDVSGLMITNGLACLPQSMPAYSRLVGTVDELWRTQYRGPVGYPTPGPWALMFLDPKTGELVTKSSSDT